MLGAYNIEYCKKFSEAKLRKMYNGEDPKVLEALIKECFGAKKQKEKESDK